MDEDSSAHRGFHQHQPPPIRPVNDDDRRWIESLIAEHWGSPLVVVHGMTYRPGTLAGFVAEGDGRPVGLLTHVVQGEACEIVTLNSLVRDRGIGTALIERAKAAAKHAGCKRLWLVTTNDNLDAVRFYQKRGFELVCVRRNVVERSRRIKPEIPSTGNDGIPIRDEIELELHLEEPTAARGPQLAAGPLVLRPFRSGDELALVENANDRAIWLGLRDSFPHPYTVADAEAWIDLTAAQRPTTNFAITLDDNLIGGIALLPGQDVYRHTGEVGYWVGQRHWGHGYATLALRAITDYAFETLMLQRLHAAVFSSNPASARVLRKGGYELESTERWGAIKDGRVLDRWIYVQLRPRG